MTKPQDIDQIILKPAHWQLDDYHRAKQSLYQAMLEVIGEDEYSDDTDTTRRYAKLEYFEERLARNELRAEQRQRLKDLFGVGDES